MNPIIYEFLDYLNHENEPDYGDFNREVDLHLKKMAECLRPLTAEQALQISRMREQLLWSNRGDIEEMRSVLCQEVKYLQDASPP